jgi:glutaconate CoA-transferase subunit B
MNSPSRLGSLLEILGGFVQRGLVTTGFLGGAQIDEHANINSSWVRRDDSWIRLPGSGGANDIASLCQKVVVLTTHERRRFPERCDYITSPGFLDGPGARRRAGMGPMDVKIVTDLGVMTGDDAVGRLSLTKLMPGVTADQVCEQTGFQPHIPGHIETVELPTHDELMLLRNDLDPAGRYFPERETQEAKVVHK